MIFPEQFTVPEMPKKTAIPKQPKKLGDPVKSWYLCPVCRMRLFKTIPGAKAHGILIKCKRCKNNINVSL